MVPDPPMTEMSGQPLFMIDNTSFVPLNFSSAGDMISYNVTNSTVNVTKVTNISISYMRRDPLIVVIPMTILYSLIFISGLLGNVITCIVIAKNRAMHTATNYYLFSLAISDLLLLSSGMPFEIYEIWFRFQPYPFGEGICILQGFAAETSANATVLTITAFTAERYIAICHPFLSHTMSKLSRAIKFILGIWLLAMGLAIPQILDLGIIEKYETCGPKNDERKYVFTISSIVCFVFPMVIITVFYILIGLQLRKSKIVGRSATANGNSIRLKTKYRVPSKRPILITLDKDEKTNPLLMPPQTHSMMEVVYNENKHDAAQRTTTRCHEEGRKNYSQNRYTGSRHVINMLVAVVVAFFVCWAPHHAQRIFAMNADEKHADIYDIITPISGVLYYVSTCINPLLYNIMSYKFREAFKDTCARCVYQRGRGQFPTNGRLSRNVSQRSNSHSIHTCSSICSGQLMQQVNACILEQDLSLLKCSKRPLTVTFRKLGRHQHTNPQVGISSEIYPSDVSRKSSTKVYTQQPLSYREDFNAYNGHVGTLLCKDTTPGWKDQKENIGCNPVLSREKEISTSKMNERLPTMKSRNSFECNYSSTSNKDMPPSSPYETPEMSASTKKLEKNLQNILKDLTMNDELSKSHASDTPPAGIVKSRSISNFTISK